MFKQETTAEEDRCRISPFSAVLKVIHKVIHRVIHRHFTEENDKLFTSYSQSYSQAVVYTVCDGARLHAQFEGKSRLKGLLRLNLIKE